MRRTRWIFVVLSSAAALFALGLAYPPTPGLSLLSALVVTACLMAATIAEQGPPGPPISESEWLGSHDPQRLLLSVGSGPRHWRTSHELYGFEKRWHPEVVHQASDRKLRLFACACSRLRWDGRESPRFREAVELAERHADGGADDSEWADAQAACWMIAGYESRIVAWNVVEASTRDGGLGTKVAGQVVCDLLREIVGNPFRPARVDPLWLTPHVERLATAIYEERAFARMPELAEALASAGCEDAAILGHCRSGGEHVRGCWVVDAVLGRA